PTRSPESTRPAVIVSRNGESIGAPAPCASTTVHGASGGPSQSGSTATVVEQAASRVVERRHEALAVLLEAHVELDPRGAVVELAHRQAVAVVALPAGV